MLTLGHPHTSVPPSIHRFPLGLGYCAATTFLQQPCASAPLRCCRSFPNPCAAALPAMLSPPTAAAPSQSSAAPAPCSLPCLTLHRAPKVLLQRGNWKRAFRVLSVAWRFSEPGLITDWLGSARYASSLPLPIHVPDTRRWAAGAPPPPPAPRLLSSGIDPSYHMENIHEAKMQQQRYKTVL